MDLIGFDETAYDAVVREFVTFAEKLTIKNIVFVPMSALKGDNVVTASTDMPWYQGGPLLHQLETITVGGRANRIDFRFPVQFVIRPDQTFRGYAGTIASGSVRAGDEIVVLPSGHATRVKAIETVDGARPDAAAGDAVVLTTVTSSTFRAAT